MALYRVVPSFCRVSGDLSKRSKRTKPSTPTALLDYSSIPISSSSCDEPSYPFAVPLHAYSTSTSISSSQQQHAAFNSPAGFAGKSPAGHPAGGKDTEKTTSNPAGHLSGSNRSSSPTRGISQTYMLHDSSSNNNSSNLFTGASAASAAAAAASSVLRFNVVGSAAGSNVLPKHSLLKKGVNSVALDMASMCKR